MKRAAALLLLGLIVLGGYSWRLAHATITCSLPFTLQNNTVADATQVMANYNALVTCFTQAASAGVNSDITSLTGLSTPLPAASGGTQTYVGGTSTGAANAQVIATVTPTSFTLTAGKKVTFKAGFSNTAATTLNVNSTGVTNLFRRTQSGVVAMVGGEIVIGDQVEAVYDGTQFQCVSCGQVLVGEIRDYGGQSGTAPTGWAFIDGSAVSRTTYAALFTILGTSFGAGDGSTTFNLPDGRGRLLAGRDNMGGSAANRITAGTSGCAGGTLGTGCGTQALAVTQANLPNYNLSLASVTATDTGHTHGPGGLSGTTGGVTVNHVHGAPAITTASNFTTGGATTAVTGYTAGVSGAGQTGNDSPDHAHNFSVTAGTTATGQASISVGGTLPSGGSGVAYVPLNPLQIVQKIIKL